MQRDDEPANTCASDHSRHHYTRWPIGVFYVESEKQLPRCKGREKSRTRQGPNRGDTQCIPQHVP